MWTKTKFSFDWLTYFLVVSYICVFTDKNFTRLRMLYTWKFFFGDFERNLKGAWGGVKKAANQKKQLELWKDEMIPVAMIYKFLV